MKKESKKDKIITDFWFELLYDSEKKSKRKTMSSVLAQLKKALKNI